jgi:undecaprenyl-diphosphatase
LTFLQAIVLGFVQGLGEFLPISSSAHLVLVPWLFRWQDPGLTFDIALHLGTLVAVLLYFLKDWLRLLAAGTTAPRSSDGRLFWYLVIASVPGAAIGFLLEDKAETVFRTPLLIAFMLIVMGLVLYWADRRIAHKVEVKEVSFATSFLIGLSQALAIIPGVSRSGVTMSAGLFLGLTREAAARFSFLLSMPIILGAALVKVPEIVSHPEMVTASFVAGMIVSCVTGILSIWFLLRYVQTKDFLPFVWYRLALGCIVIAVALMR